MVIKIVPPDKSGKPSKRIGPVIPKVQQEILAPYRPPGGQLQPAPQYRPQNNGPSEAQRQAAAAAAAAAQAESRAKAAGKSQTAKENANTQAIIDALLRGANQFAKGRDVQLGNADRALQAGLAGIDANYKSAVGDYLKTGLSNDQDEASKSAANVTNRARERTSLLEQAASMGAGETDQLRAQLQAFQNFDNNQLEILRGFFDTARSVDSQIQGANSQAVTNRRSAWQQAEEARGGAWAEFYKNWGDTWTNIQRTAAQNSNIDSDYSTGFNANFGGKNPVDEAARYAGSAYQTKDQSEAWYKNFGSRVEDREVRSTAVNRAATATVKAPKAAEGATLRRK